MNNGELEAINRLNSDQSERFWNAISSIREPVCCSLVKDNRYRLADFALKHYVRSISKCRCSNDSRIVFVFVV